MYVQFTHLLAPVLRFGELQNNLFHRNFILPFWLSYTIKVNGISSDTVLKGKFVAYIIRNELVVGQSMSGLIGTRMQFIWCQRKSNPYCIPFFSFLSISFLMRKLSILRRFSKMKIHLILYIQYCVHPKAISMK